MTPPGALAEGQDFLKSVLKPPIYFEAAHGNDSVLSIGYGRLAGPAEDLVEGTGLLFCISRRSEFGTLRSQWFRPEHLGGQERSYGVSNEAINCSMFRNANMASFRCRSAMCGS